MFWKDTVNFSKLHPAMILACTRLESIYDSFSTELWITSANDSEHKEGSKHFDGRALDFRTKNIVGISLPGLSSNDKKNRMLNRIKEALGPFFFCQIEDLGEPNEHLHIQFNGE